MCSSTIATSVPGFCSPIRSSWAFPTASWSASAASRTAPWNTSTAAMRRLRACRCRKRAPSCSRSSSMRWGRWRADWRSVLAAVALAAALPAWSGAQQYEVLSASVRATLARAVNDRANADPRDLDTRAWVRAMTPRTIGRFPDEDATRGFLALVRYEAMRAGLDPHLVLALIDVESRFRKYAVSKAGARGLMQVMPFW